MNNDFRRKIFYSLILAFLVYVGLILWNDWSQLAAALTDFPWLSLPLILALALANDLGRLLKWQWYLQLLGVKITRVDSARIFGVGMLMVMTPGKAGEFLKSYMVKNVTGTSMSITAPIILAERITDGMAMLLLGSAGLFAFPEVAARRIALFVLACFVIAVIVIQIRPLALWFLAMGQRLPVVKKFASHLNNLYESSYLIFKPRNFLISLGIGLLSWAAEGLAFYVVLRGFGVVASFENALVAIFILCMSTVIGAVVATPGGLGGVEGGLATLTVRLLGLGAAPATAAALLIRFSTLWLGVCIGVISFLLWPHLLAGSENVRREQIALGD
ncbi:MAG: lysylphosphatidylglycerol synthase transmembrane domain-containing protein [Chloroflexi bacterium]|nr:lysylphosphatidylglycerol synthase transmembrane domain-containing protein [Chloroflexota bacterium]